eukprot:CAMPEP_0178912640 /NCGR_PEP_ID=MMETSP0786-20121207/10386_1 /TAXON_ID=186022 /ORGANISM="Thalassionema frauenfeldii, Strain CCMP 1798" /LENGTH=558 /DNA_ID=CAMNT_0020585267 /DNA_START=27 /DNA_END=1700 /DNA_ORIENTATION=+
MNFILVFLLCLVVVLTILQVSSQNDADFTSTSGERELSYMMGLERIGDPSKHLNNTELNRRRKLTSSVMLYDLNTLRVDDLVDTLLGDEPDLTISNIEYIGADIAAGSFSTNDTYIFGFNEGIILTTGSVANIQGPNINNGTSQRNGLPGDEQLNTLIRETDDRRTETQDATVLKFDFECDGVAEISFQYVFMSEEYNEFVGDRYNDVFGFFLNGENIARLPDGNNTAINSVHCGSTSPTFDPPPHNCDLFVDNGDGSYFTEMDGFTKVLTAHRGDINTTNTIRLAIADVADDQFDSAVMIKSGSFSCTLPSDVPSSVPSEEPSLIPSSSPSLSPSSVPSIQPSRAPSDSPSVSPSTYPSTSPTDEPSASPSSLPSELPTDEPSTSPSSLPSELPTEKPSSYPSDMPSLSPSLKPSVSPSDLPSSSPSLIPTKTPSDSPSVLPSDEPSTSPSDIPSSLPSFTPSKAPSNTPSALPSLKPTTSPSDLPSSLPSLTPTTVPTGTPTTSPSGVPSGHPSDSPSESPSVEPSTEPSGVPTITASIQPSAPPTSSPSVKPTST